MIQQIYMAFLCCNHDSLIYKFGYQNCNHFVEFPSFKININITYPYGIFLTSEYIKVLLHISQYNLPALACTSSYSVLVMLTPSINQIPLIRCFMITDVLMTQLAAVVLSTILYSTICVWGLYNHWGIGRVGSCIGISNSTFLNWNIGWVLQVYLQISVECNSFSLNGLFGYQNIQTSVLKPKRSNFYGNFTVSYLWSFPNK